MDVAEVLAGEVGAIELQFQDGRRHCRPAFLDLLPDGVEAWGQAAELVPSVLVGPFAGGIAAVGQGDVPAFQTFASAIVFLVAADAQEHLVSEVDIDASIIGQD